MRGLGEGSEARLPDCKAAVFGLTQLLKEAIYRPGPLAGQVLSVLLQFLRQVYAGAYFTTTTCVLRINVSSYSTLSSYPSARMRSKGYCVFLGLSSLSVTLHLCSFVSQRIPPTERATKVRTFEGQNIRTVSLKTLRYKARALPLVRSRPFLSLRIRPL